jgi:predicted MPP superfamily phosphohydrolase
MLLNGNVRTEQIALHLRRHGLKLTGLRIVQLSDLHIRRVGHRENKLIDIVNGTSPEYIFLTGDLVPAFHDEFSACLRVLSQLKARNGIYAVLGNADHTIAPKKRFEDFVSGLQNSGIVLLRNRNVYLAFRGNRIALAGVDDPFLQYDDFDEAVSGLSFEEPTMLLSHSPDILFPRGDALVVNLLDSGHKKDYFKSWGWSTTTYFSPESGEFFFEPNGRHTMRVQSRQEGVSIDILLLNPYPELDQLLNSKQTKEIEELVQMGHVTEKYPGLVLISANTVDGERCHGKWKKCRDRETLSGFRLDDLPARHGWQYQPLLEPSDYFEADFTAKSDTKYRLWVRMKAFKGSPHADSVYIQFNDAIDKARRRRYEIGVPAASKSRLESFDLILTGHTHGGQIRLPLYGAVETLTSVGRKYAAGLHNVGQSLLYVSRGVGYSRIPVRFLCPPEITVMNFN